MGRELYANNPQAKKWFERANDLLGFRITDIMFEGSEADLQQTKVTQPAIFLLSVIMLRTLGDKFQPDMVAGHSLGEFSALTAAGALSFDNALSLVAQRAKAMQKACDAQPSAMAAILGLPDEEVEDICASIDATVVPANYNCPKQVVISGDLQGVEQACEALLAAGAQRAIKLKVGGAFHSPLMQPASDELAQAIDEIAFTRPSCPIYQNVDAQPHTDPAVIKDNLIVQLTAPVRWRQTIEQMHADGADRFIEAGPGAILQGLIKKTLPSADVEGLSFRK